MSGLLKDVNYFTPKSKPIITDGEVARQEIYLLLNTIPSEKPFDSNYGVDLQSYLFDIVSNGSADALYFEIVDKIKTYVSSIVLDESRSDVDVNDDLNGYDISIVFKLINADENGDNYIVTKKVVKNG